MNNLLYGIFKWPWLVRLVKGALATGIVAACTYIINSGQIETVGIGGIAIALLLALEKAMQGWGQA